jgi:hypothetical protein
MLLIFSEKNYRLNNDIVEQVEENPYLGVLISEDLKWTKHIANITKRASQTLGFLRRNLRTCQAPAPWTVDA